jgi:hypothetical protein
LHILLFPRFPKKWEILFYRQSMHPSARPKVTSPPRPLYGSSWKLSHVLGTHWIMCTPLEFRSNSIFFHQGAICENTFLAITPYVLVVKLPNFVCWCIYKNLGFWPWPTFQGHGGQTSKIYTMWYNFATIAYISINFSHWIHLTRVCLMQSE